MARINFVLPSLPTKPVGGVKNMFQFANRLQARGHQVTIYYSVRRPFKKQKTPVWLRLILYWLRRRKVSWFPLDPAIAQRIVPEVSNRYIGDADATMSTWWQMAYAVSNLPDSKGTRCNFIQDYELWTGQEDRVHDSYSLPVQHIVIARYLQDIVEKYSGRRPPLVNTPIDVNLFTRQTLPADREPASLIMMYSEESRKGTKFGIEALQLVKQRIPEFKATLFGVYPRPVSLPSWIGFHHRPGNLPELYNRHALFLSPSLGEGWALPPAEAMACGCAVVCTDIGGHRDYAFDQRTALLVQPQQPVEMADRIIQLIEDSEKRLSISEAAYHLIRNDFSWDTAVQKLESIILSSAVRTTDQHASDQASA